MQPSHLYLRQDSQALKWQKNEINEKQPKKIISDSKVTFLILHVMPSTSSNQQLCLEI